MNHRTLGFGAAAAVALAGCTPLGSPGSLQNGGFAYVCGSGSQGATDTACTTSAFHGSDVPAAIAVGTHFELQFNAVFSSDTPPVTALDSAASTLLAKEPALETGATGFRFVKPSIVAVLARTAGDTVRDFLHVTGVAIDHVEVQDLFTGTPVTSVTFPTSNASFVASPQGGAGQPLAGSMTYTWSSSDETVVTVQAVQSLEGTGPANQVKLVPGNGGQAVVTLTVLGKQASIDVTVNPGGAP